MRGQYQICCNYETPIALEAARSKSIMPTSIFAQRGRERISRYDTVLRAEYQLKVQRVELHAMPNRLTRLVFKCRNKQQRDILAHSRTNRGLKGPSAALSDEDPAALRIETEAVQRFLNALTETVNQSIVRDEGKTYDHAPVYHPRTP